MLETWRHLIASTHSSLSRTSIAPLAIEDMKWTGPTIAADLKIRRILGGARNFPHYLSNKFSSKDAQSSTSCT